jgi:hypothetical protein
VTGSGGPLALPKAAIRVPTWRRLIPGQSTLIGKAVWTEGKIRATMIRLMVPRIA